jgi:hypothetical protein
MDNYSRKVKTVTLPWIDILPPMRAQKPQLGRRRLELIKQDISLIQNLHPSFWSDPKFIRWQLVRLNKNYQKVVDTLWYKFWSWFDDKYSDVINLDRETLDQYFAPHFPKGKFSELLMLRYQNSVSYDGGFIERCFTCWGEFKPSTEESIEDWRTNIGDIFMDNLNWESLISLLCAIEKENSEIRSLMPGWCIRGIKPSPIPWTVRFPIPFMLDRFPDWPEEGKKIKGRPPKWAENLLVYELSQAGMKDMDIVRLLFRIDKSTEFYPDKNPILVRINTIKKTVQKVVSQAYPFLQST